MSLSGFIRTTIDIDFMIFSTQASSVDKIMKSFGYEIRHKSVDVINYVSPLKPLGEVDFLLAHRKYAVAMLNRAKVKELFNGEFKVKALLSEDIIGLKVQSIANDPERYNKDIVDIENLVKANKDVIDHKKLREYFELFDRLDEYNKLVHKLGGKDAK